MKILGIDPGYAIVGWGVVEEQPNSTLKVLGYGAIKTSANSNFSTRLESIYIEMLAIIAKFKPNELAIEKLFFQINKKTAIDVAQARGVLILAAKQSFLKIAEYSPLQVKQGISGYGRATKQQIMQMCQRILKLSSIPKPDDAADAIAIAVAHANCCKASLPLIERNLI